ncbi:DUF6906 family protein [Paenibacillus sp. IHBB 10380]|uniref:DUF6906 family protein n=1 Tax=Paenibacillus sp. IHBB 10380 TaxID=1566358 RepID=UPI000AD43218|nr:hypothetical protein [Paenibacillus sp. IHBB 10380]
MKHLKKPTRRQKLEIASRKLIPGSWLVERDDGRELVIVSKEKGQVRRLRWGA